MAEDSRLRVGGWVQTRGGAPEGAAGDDPWADPVAAERGDDEFEGLDDPTAAVERLPVDSDDTVERYRGHRRAEGEPVTLRRVLAVAIMVGALLIGIGFMANSLAPGPATPPVPPPTPEGHAAEVDPDQGTARLGPAPTGSPEATAAPAPTPPPDDEGSPGDGPSTPTPPTPTTPPTSPPIASYESEDADLGSHAEVQAMDGASGGEVVELTGGSAGASVRHTGVTVGEAGQYRLTVFYVSDQQRSAQVSANGVGATITFPATGRGEVGSVTLSVDLAAGANAIEIRNTGGRGLYLDRITIAD